MLVSLMILIALQINIDGTWALMSMRTLACRGFLSMALLF